MKLSVNIACLAAFSFISTSCLTTRRNLSPSIVDSPNSQGFGYRSIQVSNSYEFFDGKAHEDPEQNSSKRLLMVFEEMGIRSDSNSNVDLIIRIESSTSDCSILFIESNCWVGMGSWILTLGLLPISMIHRSNLTAKLIIDGNSMEINQSQLGEMYWTWWLAPVAPYEVWTWANTPNAIGVRNLANQLILAYRDQQK